VTEDGWCLHYAGTYEETLRTPDVHQQLIDPKRSHDDRAGLFHLPSDPGEQKNVIDAIRPGPGDPRRYVAWLEEIGRRASTCGRRKLR